MVEIFVMLEMYGVGSQVMDIENNERFERLDNK